MYFDIDDRYESVDAVGSAMSRREGVLLSVVVHGGILLLLLFAPKLGWFAATPVKPAEADARPKPDRPQFVIVEPLRDVPAPTPPPKADASDMDRVAKAPQIAERPENALPFSRGESPERVEAAPEERARGRGPEPEPSPPAPPAPPARPADEAVPLPESPNGPAIARQPPTPTEPSRPAGGALGEALRDLQKYVQREAMNNPQGGTSDFGPLQFDTKGVEFGPWVRRFIAQVKRNWFIPNAALAMRGRVVVTFNVHKDGSITDVTVIRPSEVDSFNRSAYNALIGSNPTQPLPPEYPADKAFFTVTFFYNESPTQQ